MMDQMADIIQEERTDKAQFVVLYMKDPRNCSGCFFNDVFNHCCKAVKKQYGNENLTGESKPAFCPLYPLYREPYGNFIVVNNN